MKSTFFKSHKYDLFFILSLFFVSLLYNYHNILTHRPYSMHQWRQADCLSITTNYYSENRKFLEPAIHWVGEKDGKTVSECPILYYSVAQLWKIFGKHEFIIRLLNILIVFSGIFCLYKLTDGLINDKFWAFFVPLLLFTSPILAFYTNNFLADAPALGLSLIGCYFIWKGFTHKKIHWYLISFLFFTLCGLIKISSLILFTAILLIHTYVTITSRNKENSWLYKWYSLLPYIVVFVIIYVWYNFARDYNSNNLSGIFLLNLFPFWEIDVETRTRIWNNLYFILLPAYFNKKMLFVVFSLFIVLCLFYKKTNKVLFHITLLVFLGITAYVFLFFQAFTVHDYYLLNLLVFVPLPLIAVIEMLKRHYPNVFNSRIIKGTALAALILLIYETAVITRMKYSTNDWLVKTNVVLTKGDVDQWTWFHSNYRERMQAYETITPYLRGLGIKRTDRVISLPDESINISLYLMNQKGFTGFGYSSMSFDEKMNFFQRYGAKYLIIDSSLHHQGFIKPYITQKIGHYRNIEIFDIKQFTNEKLSNRPN